MPILKRQNPTDNTTDDLVPIPPSPQNALTPNRSHVSLDPSDFADLYTDLRARDSDDDVTAEHVDDDVIITSSHDSSDFDEDMLREDRNGSSMPPDLVLSSMNRMEEEEGR